MVQCCDRMHHLHLLIELILQYLTWWLKCFFATCMMLSTLHLKATRSIPWGRVHLLITPYHFIQFMSPCRGLHMKARLSNHTKYGDMHILLPSITYLITLQPGVNPILAEQKEPVYSLTQPLLSPIYFHVATQDCLPSGSPCISLTWPFCS